MKSNHLFFYIVVSFISALVYQQEGWALVKFKCGIYEIDGALSFKPSKEADKLIMPTLTIFKGTLSEQKVPILMDEQLQREFEANKTQEVSRRLKVRFYEESTSPRYGELLSLNFKESPELKKENIKLIELYQCKK
jgi:hypothetical protein